MLTVLILLLHTYPKWTLGQTLGETSILKGLLIIRKGCPRKSLNHLSRYGGAQGHAVAVALVELGNGWI